jgi:hypothetical protein
LATALFRNAVTVQDWSSAPVTAAAEGPAWDEVTLARAGAAAESAKHARAAALGRLHGGADPRLAAVSAAAPTHIHPADAVGAAGALAVSGWMLMNTRISSWLLAMLASRPAWRQFDPLEVLYSWEQSQQKSDEEDDTGESLHTLLDRPQ